MSMIELTHGGILTRGNGSMDIFVSYRSTPKSDDQPLHLAAKDPNSGIREPGGIVETFPSSRVHSGKSLTKRRVDFPDGSFVRFTIKHLKGGTVGAFRQAMYNFIISPRETAPLQEIKIALPNDANSNVSAVYITGRFDIMMPKEILERKLNQGTAGGNDLSTYDLASLDEIIKLRVMEQASRPRIKSKMVVNKQTGVAVARLRRPRRINLPT